MYFKSECNTCFVFLDVLGMKNQTEFQIFFLRFIFISLKSFNACYLISLLAVMFYARHFIYESMYLSSVFI